MPHGYTGGFPQVGEKDALKWKKQRSSFLKEYRPILTGGQASVTSSGAHTYGRSTAAGSHLEGPFPHGLALQGFGSC